MNWKKIINLSPLVDVLMIVIFWYIMMSNQTIEDTKETAQNELAALQNRYEAELAASEEENAGLTEQVAGLTGEVETLMAETESLAAEAETYRQINDDLSDQLSVLRSQNDALGMMLEQSVGYLYIRLYDGLHKNRIVEINSDAELVDKFVFSSGETDFLRGKIEKAVTEYVTGKEKKRVAVIFMYVGDNSLYEDVHPIQEVLDSLKTKYNLAVLELNLAE